MPAVPAFLGLVCVSKYSKLWSGGTYGCWLLLLKIRLCPQSFKKHFPHLSLGAPAHHTKPPIWFSTAVNFAGLVSTIVGRKATTAQCPVFHSLSHGELSGFGVVCRASPVWSSFFSFWHFKCSGGLRGWEPGLSDREVRQGLVMLSLRGQLSAPYSEIMKGVQRRETSVAAADPWRSGRSSSFCWCWGCFGAEVAQELRAPGSLCWCSC